MQPHKEPSITAKVGWVFVCMFLAFIAVGLFTEIENDRNHTKEEKATQTHDKQHVKNNAAYVVWFQENNELFHKRLEELEAAGKKGNPPAEERDALRDVMSEAITHKVSDNSDFYYIHQDYIKAFKKINDAFLYATWQKEYKEKMREGKQMEVEAVEEFIHRKESIREDY